MSSSLQFFLDEALFLKNIDEPDESIDQVFMLSAEDWKTMLQDWDLRSEDWKCGFVYIAGFCELSTCKSILFKAISDESKVVWEDGLFALHLCISEEIEETGKFGNILSSNEIELVKRRLSETDEVFRVFPEYAELKKILAI